jgi:DNA polymerase III delta prime subunit
MSIKKLSSQSANRDVSAFSFLSVPGPLHHAYIISGGNVEIGESLKEALRVREEQSERFLFSFETLSKEDALELRTHASFRSYQDTSRYIVLTARAWTREAQNALLKMLEEPGPNTHFFLLAQSAEVFLPTIRSRAHIIDIGQENKKAVLPLAEAKKFLESTRGMRIEYVSQFIKQHEDDETSGPRREDAANFLSALEVLLTEEGTQKNANALKTILSAKSYLTNQGALVKMVLENVALSV